MFAFRVSDTSAAFSSLRWKRCLTQDQDEANKSKVYVSSTGDTSLTFGPMGGTTQNCSIDTKTAARGERKRTGSCVFAVFAVFANKAQFASWR